MSRIGLPGRSGVGAPLPNPTGQSPRAAVSLSNARAEASRRNGAKSRGPKTHEGKARSARNALKHGMRAQKYVVLPDEDADEFAGLEAAMIAELAPSERFRRCSPGVSRSPPGGSRGRIGWPPERGWGPVPQPGGQQADLFAERSWGADPSPGLA